MSGAETVVVTQADREAVQAFHRAMAEKLFADIASGKPPTFGDDAGHDGDTIHQAFARHRLATQADALAVMREAEAVIQAFSRILGPVYMTLAQQECIDEPLPREAVILSFMGSGASDNVTVGEVEDASNNARTTLANLRAAIARREGE